MIMLNKIQYYRKYFWEIGKVEILRKRPGAQEQQIKKTQRT